jgi:methyl-accepting chemotaxis protein
MKISTRLLMLVGAAIVAIAAIGASSLSTLYSALMHDREMQIETMLAMACN